MLKLAHHNMAVARLPQNNGSGLLSPVVLGVNTKVFYLILNGSYANANGLQLMA